jgi:hypothetical protein
VSAVRRLETDEEIVEAVDDGSELVRLETRFDVVVCDVEFVAHTEPLQPY